MTITHTPDMRVVSRELLEPGTVVGRHRIAGKLAEGTHAILYMGEHVETSARVAIKVLRWAWARHPEAIARFNREAHVMGRLAMSPNVVHVHDIGDSPDGRRYLVMEFVRGRELSLVLANAKHRSEPMDIERACQIARDVAAALRDSHGKGVVHRDVKPSNIMVVREPDGREQAKLVDFGVSSDLENKGVGPDLTVAGSVIGTQEYMAPEQAVGMAAAPAMDIFAIGVVLFEMLTTQLPPAEALRHGMVPPVSTLRPGVPASLDELVRDCLQYDPARRPTTAIEVITRLGIVLDELRGRHSSPNKWAGGRPLKAAGAIESSEDAVGPMTDDDAVQEVSRGHTEAVRGRSPWVAVSIGLAIALTAGVVAWVVTTEDEGEPTRAVEAATVAPREPAPIVPPPREPVVPVPSVAATDAVPPTPEVTPEPTPEPTPKPPKPTPPKPKPTVKPDAKTPDSPECKQARESATSASSKLAWRDVLQNTGDAACWASGTERLRLRVEAFAELGRFEECVRAAGTNKDAKIAKTAEFCRKRLDGG